MIFEDVLLESRGHVSCKKQASGQMLPVMRAFSASFIGISLFEVVKP
jgi:hypothetical protein